MIDAESSLLEAVCERLKSVMGLNDSSCQVEIDDQAPAMAGREYWAIMPLSATPGQRNQRSGIWDMLIGVRVVLLVRIGNVPRDRRRQVFMEELKGINAKLARAASLIHFEYTNIINVANADITALNDTASPGQFYEPLKFQGFDKPQTFTADAYAAKSATSGDPIVGMKRGVSFSGARFLREVA